MSTLTASATKIPHYINGAWVESHAKDWQDVINPASGEILGSVPQVEAVTSNEFVAAIATCPVRCMKGHQNCLH